MSRERYRCWMFTLFDEPNYEHWKEQAEKIQYLIGQKEVCPSTGKEHFQGYVELKDKAYGMRSVKQILGSNNVHLERRRGNQESAIAYVTKEETRIQNSVGPYILGNKKIQGKRNDLETAVAMVKEGSKVVEVVEKLPGMLKYHKHLQWYKNELIPDRNWETEVIILQGESGTGKTRYAHEQDPDIFVCPDNEGKWFDGYEGQESVLIDDFYGTIRYDFLLKLCDRYKMKVPIKGGFVNWAPKRIYITSNQDYKAWYPQTVALERRIKMVHKFGTEVAGNTRAATLLDCVDI